MPLRLAFCSILCLAVTTVTADRADAGMLGVDLGGTPSGYTTFDSDNWTLGYKFSVNSTVTIDGLGFWDAGDGFNETTVGLWQDGGTLIDTAVTSNSAVSTFATANGLGEWNFMATNIVIGPGDYVVGSWGVGMEYAFSDTEPLIESGLTFIETREKRGGIFQYNSDALYSGTGFFGGNVSISNGQVVPEPTSIALWSLGLVGMTMARRRRS